MNRAAQLDKLKNTQQWDIVIIGGGATGLGSAIDAASRGLSCLLIEQFDFAKGTSSKSTKLIHGGVRYLQQGNFKLVMEALKERAYMLQNTAHLSHKLAFIIPVYTVWDKWKYTIGLKLYDLLSGMHSIGKTAILSKEATIQSIPNIETKHLIGGIQYYDGQFDDSALCVEMASTAIALGATVINYCKATNFIKPNNKITGVEIEDYFTKNIFKVHAKVVINATGVFTNTVMQLDDHLLHDYVTPSQGIHLIIDAAYFKGSRALLIPRTTDGRVLFAVPWQHKVILGTTDTPINKIEMEPRPLEEEINFILANFNQFCRSDIQKKDILSVYVGLRPLINKEGANSANLSRSHAITVSKSGLITITGGKWTTYRKMAEDAINNALFVGKLPKTKCITKQIVIGDSAKKAADMQAILKENPNWSQLIHPDFPYNKAAIIYAIRFQMALQVEDILGRRIRILFFDARLAIQIAPEVARLMATELQKDNHWTMQQINEFTQLAKQYIV